MTISVMIIITANDVIRDMAANVSILVYLRTPSSISNITNMCISRNFVNLLPCINLVYSLFRGMKWQMQQIAISENMDPDIATMFMFVILRWLAASIYKFWMMSNNVSQIMYMISVSKYDE